MGLRPLSRAEGFIFDMATETTRRASMQQFYFYSQSLGEPAGCFALCRYGGSASVGLGAAFRFGIAGGVEDGCAGEDGCG